MTNVLPPQSQKILWQSYIARITIVASIAAIILAGIVALAIAPAKLTLIIADNAMSYGPQPTTDQIATPEDRAAITNTQALLTQAAPYMATSTSVVNAISAALALRPKGVVVDHIAYTTGKANTIVLSGTATRDQINAYKAAVSADTHFSSVYVPVETLVGSQDRTFTMTLSGKF